MKRFLVGLFLFCVWMILAGCLESSFQLSDESRWPKWFEIPTDYKRKDLTIRMDLHSTFGGSKNVVGVYKKGSFFPIMQFSITSDIQSGIRSVHLSEPHNDYPKGYPRYKVITINGITDIVELRKMEPYFYMTDDEYVWEELGVKRKGD